MKLPKFNAPKAAYCTCPPKYNINTYLGRCAHRCIYCYAVKFPSFTGPPTPRQKILTQIEKMAKNTKPKFPVMMSDCTKDKLCHDKSPSLIASKTLCWSATLSKF